MKKQYYIDVVVMKIVPLLVEAESFGKAREKALAATGGAKLEGIYDGVENEKQISGSDDINEILEYAETEMMVCGVVPRAPSKRKPPKLKIS